MTQKTISIKEETFNNLYEYYVRSGMTWDDFITERLKLKESFETRCLIELLKLEETTKALGYPDAKILVISLIRPLFRKFERDELYYIKMADILNILLSHKHDVWDSIISKYKP